uniref:Uncharacterized protein n=1 Tax=Rhinopithecus bieti TaxID=61621 RepID=A0A2K6JSJ6_RHIBE
MEEAGICGLREKADMLCNSESNDILQHQDSNYSATSNKHLLEDREGSDFITKNRSWVSPVHCTQESRNELPAQEVTPPRGQQDLQCNRNKEKVLGNDLCKIVLWLRKYLLNIYYMPSIVLFSIFQENSPLL